MVMTIVEFLRQRLDEDEADIEFDPYDARYRNLEFGRADIAAKRAILAWCGERDQIYVGTISSDPDLPGPDDFVPGHLANPEGGILLRHLASVHSDHPDYREEWKPC